MWWQKKKNRLFDTSGVGYTYRNVQKTKLLMLISYNCIISPEVTPSQKGIVGGRFLRKQAHEKKYGQKEKKVGNK